MTKTRKGLGCLVLFALPFAGAGLFVGFLALKMLWLWVDVRDWYQVPTEILEVHLTVSDGEDGDTYKVEARYRYEFDGQIYEGDRVGLSFGSDNIGSYHQDKYDELRGYRSRDETFWCYVDPEAPTDSILYREMRWGLFALLLAFSLIFAGAGIGLIVGGIWAVGRVEKDEQRSALKPDRPWLWKEEWAEGRIEATGKAQFVLPCIMAIFWNLISTPLLFLLPEEILEKKNHLAALGLVFPLVGVGLLIWAGRSMIRWRKFGDSVFEMSTFPGVIGGPLTGRILTSVDLEPADGFHIGLSSINKVTSGSGDSRSTSERILWQDERHILHEAAAYDPTRSEIPVEFTIPYSASPTDDSNSDNEFLWRLQVEAEVPGVDYHATFDVPVFRTEESRADPDDDRDHDPWPAEDPPTLDLGPYGIESELLFSGARRLTIRAARHKGPALGLTFFMVLWLGFNYLLIHLDAPIFFPILWGLFSLLIFFGVLDLWFERRIIEVHSDRLLLQGGIFGLGRPKEIQMSEIREISPIRGMQSGNKLYYRVQVTTLDDKKHIAATKLENLSLAQALIESME